ncbi:unnamed protein product [Clavelina lepadiformis]|uniref:Uncharacterized protein n=1 Tax=Clavelina lepadiformis TaxID=159417 RepID=A0ABP0F650_CLALP
MPTVKEIIGLLSYIAYKQDVMFVAGDNSRRCVIMTDPLRRTYTVLGRTFTTRVTIAPPNFVVALLTSRIAPANRL